jgi:CheY-like chemotaxis protein
MDQPKVLIVDDDRLIHAIIDKVLEGRGVTVLHASDGVTALAMARSARPDLVITDALLPHLDGRELAKQLKTTEETRHCKVAIMTGLYKGNRYRSEAFKEFLVDEYLEKPVHPDKILQLVESIIR